MTAPYYAPTARADRDYVCKTWHRPPGLARDFRGWAVIVDGREVALYARATDAYADLDAR